ncbi:hypothetical protein GCM10027174_44840 [Salinifilum aidingensis]
MSTPTTETARPIDLPALAPSSSSTEDLPQDAETAAQNLTRESAEELVEDEDDDVVDFRGTDFDLDLGSSRAPVVLFAALTVLAVLLGVYATTALVVQIGAGLIAAGAATLAIRSIRRTR